MFSVVVIIITTTTIRTDCNRYDAKAQHKWLDFRLSHYSPIWHRPTLRNFSTLCPNSSARRRRIVRVRLCLRSRRPPLSIAMYLHHSTNLIHSLGALWLASDALCFEAGHSLWLPHPSSSTGLLMQRHPKTLWSRAKARARTVCEHAWVGCIMHRRQIAVDWQQTDCIKQRPRQL